MVEVKKKKKKGKKPTDKAEIGRQNILPARACQANDHVKGFSAKYSESAANSLKSVHTRWVPSKMLRDWHMCNITTYIAALNNVDLLEETPKHTYNEWVKDLEVNEKMERLRKYQLDVNTLWWRDGYIDPDSNWQIKSILGHCCDTNRNGKP